MALTFSANSKSNVKKSTTNDLPFAPQQPVISSYYAVTTAGQTTIANLGFSVDTINAADSFFLFIDGKKFTLGSSNDFTFAAIAADGTSSSVTFNQALPVNLNIQAYKMGLKKESEFLTDNRFTQLYEAEGQAFQGFVNTQSKVLTPTTTTGTPAAGKFYSTITNRATITDLTQDLKVSMGIERIMTQQIVQLQTEFGPNGEPVWASPNDSAGQLRFVGSWLLNNNNYGVRPYTTTANDYVEVTFYGTGLNRISFWENGTSITYSVDGGSASTISAPASYSSVLGGRNYSKNEVHQIVSGLALGTHTVKIAFPGGGEMDIFGFEVLTEKTSVQVNPGTAYVSGKKLTSAAIGSLSYNSGFESGTLGARGGRVLTYIKADGTFGQAVQPVNAAAAYLTSADHTNEEIVRTHYFREFGAGRTDDFSLFAASSVANAAFTLEDGTTTLSANQIILNNSGLNLQTDNTSFITLTFVGSGIDFVLQDNSATTNSSSSAYQYFVDGSSIGFHEQTGTAGMRTKKIASGLPYGTHTVRILRNTANSFTPNLFRFIVYQPKKPTLPSGAVELADYNVMANYVASTTVGGQANVDVSAGVLYKACIRELTYTGTWSIDVLLSHSTRSGFMALSSTAGSTIQYTFFGTGLELLGTWSAGSVTIKIDGANYTGAATATNGTTWTPGTSTWAGNASSALQVSGLSLGVHTVTVTVASGTFYIDGINTITPIHSTKSNLYADLQNTLPVGSQAISDNRKVSAIKDSGLQKKNISQAFGVASSPSTSSTSAVPMPDMQVLHTNTSGRIKVSYSVVVSNSSTPADVYSTIYIDGLPAPGASYKWTRAGAANLSCNQSDVLYINVSPGTHKVEIFWFVNVGTGTAGGLYRNLLVEEA